MKDEILAGGIVRDERAKPLVLVGDLLGAEPAVEQSLQIRTAHVALLDTLPQLIRATLTREPVNLLP